MNKDYVHDLVDLGELTLDGRLVGRAQLLRCEYEYATEIGLNPLPYALRRLATHLTETDKQRAKLVMAVRKRIAATLPEGDCSLTETEEQRRKRILVHRRVRILKEAAGV